MTTTVRIDEIDDQIDFIQFSTGQTIVENFFTWLPGPLDPSTWTNFPTRYVYFRLVFFVDPSQNIINRQTYDLLAFMGDLGGL